MYLYNAVAIFKIYKIIRLYDNKTNLRLAINKIILCNKTIYNF